MEIEIIHFPKDYINILYLAGRNCYGLEKISDKTSINEKIDFVKRLIKNEHLSVLEHINVSIYIKDVSRSFLAQLTRHRLASYSVKSQHFTLHKNFKYKPLETKIMSNRYKSLMNEINKFYKHAIKAGMPKYIAREVLPNSTLTNIFMTTNIREYEWIIYLRKTSSNTPEMIQFALLLKRILKQNLPYLFGG